MRRIIHLAPVFMFMLFSISSIEARDVSGYNRLHKQVSLTSRYTFDSFALSSGDLRQSSRMDTTMYNLKINWNIKGRLNIHRSYRPVSEKAKKGISISFEALFSKMEQSQWGIGIEYQIPRALERFIGNFNFVPLYAFIIVNPSAEKRSPYLTGRLGYNFFFGDSTFKGTSESNTGLYGGVYYAYGVGISQKVKNGLIIAEILFSYNLGKMEIMSERYNVKYSNTNISIGIGF